MFSTHNARLLWYTFRRAQRQAMLILFDVGSFRSTIGAIYGVIALANDLLHEMSCGGLGRLPLAGVSIAAIAAGE